MLPTVPLPLSRQTLPFVSWIIGRHRKAIDSRHVSARIHTMIK